MEYPSEVQETVIESLVTNLNQVKTERDNAQSIATMLGHIVRALVQTVGQDGTFILTGEQMKTAEETSVSWNALEDGGIALTTE